MALLRPREITQIVRVGLGFEACFSCLRIPVSLCPELSSAFPRLRYLGPLWFPRISWTWIFFFFLSLIPFLCLFLPSAHLRMPTGQSRRESVLSVSLNTSWEASQSIVSFCFLVIHLLPCPLQPRPILFKFPAIPQHLTLHLESKDVRASNRVSAEVIDSSHRENSPAFSVNGAEPESWRVSETCKQSMAELSGRSQTHQRVSERENGGTNNCFIGKERSK